MTPPTSFQLLEKAIGEPLVGYLGALRADERSWPYIARKLQERTGVEISDESLRRWFVAFAPARPDMSVETFARRAGISRAAGYRLVAAGAVETTRDDAGRTRISEKALEQYLAERVV